MNRLAQWIRSHRVLICLGPGGVGKTTVTSALGILSARLDRRTLCLTIDPARRLAESLGVQELSAGAGSSMVELPVCKNLWAMMVDAPSAVEVATRRHLGPRSGSAMDSNRIFSYLRNTLAGFHEFACMDLLLDLVDGGLWDNIILDTPPSQHARDFLEAPQRIEEAVTSPVLNLFVDAGGKGLPGRGLIGLGTGMTMRVIGRLIGQGLVDEVAEFLILGGDMLRGFGSRAVRMKEFLRAGDIGFVVVTSPETVPECNRLHSMLVQMGFRKEIFVANRVLLYSDATQSRIAIEPLVAQKDTVPPHDTDTELNLDAILRQKLEDNYQATKQLSAAQIHTLAGLFDRIGDGHEMYIVPQMAEDVFDVHALERLLDSVHVVVRRAGG